MSELGCQSKRDIERCKVIFGAAASQILYTRLAFPPECFQLLPLDGVASRPFEEIITSGSEIQVYNIEQLRDKNNTVFFRKCRNYGLDRFLGIMTADIFPLIETENLVKFRIYFLQAKRRSENCLLEYFTFVFRYGEGGRYGLDIWRTGTGMQHVAGTESDLWQLGDYLRKLPRWTKPVQWTLAFHATEQPVDPFIGIWNFGRGEFEDANLNLQQRDGYEYARISHLEIMPLSLAENEEHDPKTSPRPKLELVDQVPDTIFSTSQTMSQTAKTMMEQKIAPTQETGNNSKHSKPGPRRAAAAQLSPPLTIASRRDHSKSATIEKVYGSEMTPNKMSHSTSPSTEDSCRSIPRKRLGTKRKPKRPLQLFEDVTSSLPPTQVIGESQSLGQRSQIWNHRQSAELGTEPTTQDWLVEEISGSVSPDPLRIFDGISLSPEALSDAQTSPGVALLRHAAPSPNIAYQLRLGSSTNDGGLIRLEPPPSVTNGHNCMSQGELRASASAKLLDITISDDEQDLRMVAVEEHHALSHTAAEKGEGLDISFNFSPHTVSRRASLFQDIPNSSEDEE